MSKLDDIKKAIKDENISYEEIYWLDSHKKEVLEYGDPVLAQWAGISEKEWRKYE